MGYNNRHIIYKKLLEDINIMENSKFNYVSMPSIDSTNNYAKFFIERNLSIDKPLILTSKRQTDGKGRYGKKFFSPEGGLYMSYLFEITSEEDLDYINYITPITALLVKRAVEKFTKEEISIKWVNDIYSNDKKVGGILTEFEQTNIGTSYVIIGIGLNCNISERDLPLPDELKDEIGFLHIDDLDGLRDEIANSLYEAFPFKENFDHRIYLDEYRDGCTTLGKKIAVEYRSGTSQRGIASDIDDDFRLVIKDEDSNELTPLSSVEASITTLDKID